MDIVVLAAGTSTEREISIVSGTGVCKALRSRGHKAILLDIFFGDPEADPADAFPESYDVDAAAAKIRKNDALVESEKKSRRDFFGPNVIELCKAADVVFMALHGSNGEDGKVQAAFDLFGIPYTGTGYLSSALAMDKTMTKHMFQAEGVPTPKGFSILAEDPDQMPESHGLSYPVIVFPRPSLTNRKPLWRNT